MIRMSMGSRFQCVDLIRQNADFPGLGCSELICNPLGSGKIRSLTRQLCGLIIDDPLHARIRACPPFCVGLRKLLIMPCGGECRPDGVRSCSQ
ncbi:MAG TPA: hypothetical protein VND94_02650 [Terriglobia bacterium]|nr:hypothetical protein [Terriglobia bacterium]